MRRIEVELRDSFLSAMERVSGEDLESALDGVERYQELERRRQEARLRTTVAWFLLGAGALILLVSLALVIGQATGHTELPTAAIATLIGAIAVEYVAMLWAVVRYLFPGASAAD